jgi:hypothetical protein
MAGYLGSVPVPQATQHRESFTCTEGQTSFATAGYTPQFLDVYLNGSHLSPADFTATNGSDVILSVAASADDVCDIISYTPFEVANQTFTGTTTMDVAAITGILTTTAATVSNGGGQFNGAINVGVDDTGYDVKFFGATAGAYMHWDQSADDLVLGVASELVIGTATSAQLLGQGIYIAAGGYAGITLKKGAESQGHNIDFNDESNALQYRIATNVASGGETLLFCNGATPALQLNAAGDIVFLTGTDLITATAGTSNFRAGVNAGDAIASGGNYNVCVGDEAGTATNTGDNNTFVGYQAGAANTSGGSSSFFGYQAGLVNNGLGQNNFFGYLSGGNTTTGFGNVAMGNLTLHANVDGDNNTAIGSNALRYLEPADGSSYNTAVGSQAGILLETGVQNTFVGGLAGDGNTAATRNTAVGYFALSAGCGDDNTAIGTQALTSATSGLNTAIGKDAGFSLTSGSSCVFVGANAGVFATTADNCVFVGKGAGQGIDGTKLTGNGNVALGVSSGLVLQGAATDNAYVGSGSGAGTTTGSSNSSLGADSAPSITTGSNNLMLGHDAGRSGSPGGNITTGSNIIVLGDENIGAAHIQVDWTVASDQRDKTDFTALDLGLDFVKALAPVTYKWDKRSYYGDKDAADYDLDNLTPDGTHKEDWLDIGFKAQEVQALEEAAGYTTAAKKNLTVSTSDDGKQMGLQYSKFVPILVKAIQEQNALIEALTARIAVLEGA